MPEAQAEQIDQPPINNEQQPTQSVSWTASEFIAHHKTAGWYLELAGVAAFAAVVLYLVTKDWVSAAVAIVGALFLGIYAGRQPRQLEYRVDQNGIHVGDKHFGYDEFKSFYVVNEGGFAALNLMPLKRFAAILTIYYASTDEAAILGLLSERLPIEEPRKDAVENLMRRIRF